MIQTMNMMNSAAAKRKEVIQINHRHRIANGMIATVIRSHIANVKPTVLKSRRPKMTTITVIYPNITYGSRIMKERKAHRKIVMNVSSETTGSGRIIHVQNLKQGLPNQNLRPDRLDPQHHPQHHQEAHIPRQNVHVAIHPLPKEIKNTEKDKIYKIQINQIITFNYFFLFLSLLFLPFCTTVISVYCNTNISEK